MLAEQCKIERVVQVIDDLIVRLLGRKVREFMWRSLTVVDGGKRQDRRAIELLRRQCVLLYGATIWMRTALPRQECSRIMTIASPELLPLREPGGGQDEAGEHGDEGRAVGGGERAVQG